MGDLKKQKLPWLHGADKKQGKNHNQREETRSLGWRSPLGWVWLARGSRGKRELGAMGVQHGGKNFPVV